MGNVIKIEHASDHFMQHHNNWIGIVCSAIFVPHKERTMRHPESFTDELDERPCFYIPLLFRKDLVTDESDHMMLFYYTRESFTFLTSFEHRDELKVVCASSDPDQYFDVEVKKYGYRRVYRHDLELSNLTTMHRKNLLPRKCKFLAIEENKSRLQFGYACFIVKNWRQLNMDARFATIKPKKDAQLKQQY